MELGGRSLNTFGLVMINVIAICSLRTLPFAAEFGWHLIFIYLFAAVGFLFPVAMITSFLTSRFPERGGLYLWVRTALGVRLGFLAIWLQWLYNLLWYPTAMVFVVNTLLLAFNLPNNSELVLALTTIIFWLITLANCYGMRISSAISIFGAIIGTLLPILLLSYFAISWTQSGGELQWHTSVNNLNALPLIVNVIFGLMGIEMSCVHSAEVKNPAKSYPRALIISCVVIVTLMMLSSLSLAMVVRHETLSMLSGVNQAFQHLLSQSQLQWLGPFIFTFIAIGGLACIGAWIIGPSKGLFVAATDGCIPKFFAKTNAQSVPKRLLVTQAILVSGLNLFYLYMPSIEQAYETLSIAASQLALIAYVLLIVSAWVLRKTDKKGFELPGGRKTLSITCLISLIVVALFFLIGFKAPPSLHIKNYVYDFWLILCMLLLMLPIIFVREKNN